MSLRPSARLACVLRAACVPALALLGATVAVCIPAAHAGLAPTLPTVTVPSLPVTVPAVPGLPPTTGATTTTAGTGSETTSSTTVEAQGGVSGQSAGSDTFATVAGAIHLASGAVSIPVSSVRAPVVLVIDRIAASPSWVGARGQRFRIVARVSDSRGYRVRGAAIAVGSAPGGRITPAGVHKTGVDGTVTVQLTTSSRLPLRKGSTLILVVRAYATAAGASATDIRRVISLPVRPR